MMRSALLALQSTIGTTRHQQSAAGLNTALVCNHGLGRIIVKVQQAIHSPHHTYARGHTAALTELHAHDARLQEITAE